MKKIENHWSSITIKFKATGLILQSHWSSNTCKFVQLYE